MPCAFDVCARVCACVRVCVLVCLCLQIYVHAGLVESKKERERKRTCTQMTRAHTHADTHTPLDGVDGYTTVASGEDKRRVIPPRHIPYSDEPGLEPLVKRRRGRSRRTASALARFLRCRDIVREKALHNFARNTVEDRNGTRHLERHELAA
jgi:hypothetical protein